MISDLKNFDKKYKDYSDSEKEILKWFFIEAIGYIGNKESTDYLISLLNKSNDLKLRCFLIEALGRLNDKKAVPVLEKAMDPDKIWAIRVLAAQSLEDITGKKYKIQKENEIQ